MRSATAPKFTNSASVIMEYQQKVHQDKHSQRRQLAILTQYEKPRPRVELPIIQQILQKKTQLRENVQKRQSYRQKR